MKIVKKRSKSRAPKLSVTPAPPTALSAEAATRRAKIIEAHAVQSPAAIEILDQAMYAFDRVQQARAELTAHGSLMHVDRHGILRPHPAIAIERNARSQIIAAFKLLGFEE